MFCQICQGYIWRTFSDHDMNCEKTFEDDSPCGISQAVMHGPEDLRDASFTRVSGDEEVVDIL